MKLLALDGNSLAYRAFFALPDTMATASGLVTNSVFGFCSMFANLVKEHDPDGIVVVFDRKEKTFRHEAAPEYKAQREKQPDTLYQQLDTIRDLLGVAGVLTLDKAGFEGDDIIATIAANLSDADELIIVTGDRDAYQLVRDPHVRVLYNKRGVSDYALYDEAGIKERTGVTPAQYADYAALRGDPSDNLDGVPGVGEKTAAKLISTYGTLAEVFANAATQTPKLREALGASKERVTRNARLMVLRRDVPIELDRGRFVPAPDADGVARMFRDLEFSNMLSRWKPFFAKFKASNDASQSNGASQNKASSQTNGASQHTGEVTQAFADTNGSDDLLEVRPVAATSWNEFVGFVDELVATRSIAFGLVWTGEAGRSAITHIVAVVGDDVANLRVMTIPVDLVDVSSLNEIASGGRSIVMHDARNVMRSLLAEGIDVRELGFDASVAAYLVDAEIGTYDAASISRRWLKRELAPTSSVPSGQIDFDSDPLDAALIDAAQAGAVALLARVPLSKRLDELGLTSLYTETELPLVRVLAKMEHIGIGCDKDSLLRLEHELHQRSDALVDTLHDLAGREFNVNSTQQLAQILFVEKGLTSGKKTKSKKGYSTDAATLEKLRPEWPDFIEALLDYRETEKLRATYAMGLINEIAPDGRIHASFNQTIARTGRLSSEHPNLHNIPVRSDAGKVFREVFVPEPGWEFLVADYNQIELRCIAHLSQDPGLLAAFNAGTDIHRATAAQVFGVAPDAVTSEQRSKAKMVSYGLAYGMEAYGLAQRLGVEVGEAKEILDAYFGAFPRVHEYMEQSVATAKRLGYTTTLFGRRRPIEGINHPNRQIQAAAQRMAMNAAIQGLAADIFKIALVRIDAALEEAGLRSRLVLQVHDEVIVEVAPGERGAVEERVLPVMESAARLDVPLVVNASWGATWAAAKVA